MFVCLCIRDTSFAANETQKLVNIFSKNIHYPDITSCPSSFVVNQSIGGVVIMLFAEFGGYSVLGFYCMESHKSIITKCLKKKKKSMIYFACM